MSDIFHEFPIKAPLRQVFQAVSTPAGLDSWWTKHSRGEPTKDTEYELSFGPQYVWRATVSRCALDREFELHLTTADEDWHNTRVTFLLEERDGVVQVQFHHAGWPTENEHYRISCYCWAMYLRLLKRYVESGEVVRYEDRLDA